MSWVLLFVEGPLQFSHLAKMAVKRGSGHTSIIQKEHTQKLRNSIN